MTIPFLVALKTRDHGHLGPAWRNRKAYRLTTVFLPDEAHRFSRLNMALETLCLNWTFVRAACISIPVLDCVRHEVSHHHGPAWRNKKAYRSTTVFLPDETYWFDH
jgi:hypothetical protein